MQKEISEHEQIKEAERNVKICLNELRKINKEAFLIFKDYVWYLIKLQKLKRKIASC